MFLRRFPAIKTDLVALLDEWATRFFEELDYVKEGKNGKEFAESMKEDLPQVIRRLTTTHMSGPHASAPHDSWTPHEQLHSGHFFLNSCDKNQ